MNEAKVRSWWPFRASLKVLAVTLKTVLVGKVSEINRESVPTNGSFVVASNHFSTGEDPGILFILLDKLTIIYKKDLEGTSFWSRIPGLIVRVFVRGAGFFPATREEKDLLAIARMNYVLSHGGRILGMPEGTSRHFGLIEAKRRGIAREAMAMNCPVLPVSLQGTSKALTDGLLLRGKHKITVIYGKPFRFSDLGLDLEKDPRGEQATTLLMVRIGAMLPEHLRGFYTEAVVEFLASIALDVGYYRNLQPSLDQLG